MKILLISITLFVATGCSSPYVNPQTSKAVSEKEQVEQLKQQNLLLKEQNAYLKRIAETLEKAKK